MAKEICTLSEINIMRSFDNISANMDDNITIDDISSVGYNNELLKGIF